MGQKSLSQEVAELNLCQTQCNKCSAVMSVAYHGLGPFHTLHHHNYILQSKPKDIFGQYHWKALEQTFMLK